MFSTLLVGFAFPADAAVEVSESYGKLPLHFEANQGQAHQDVRFLARGLGYSLYLTAGEAVLVLAKTNPVATPDAHNTKAQLKEGIRAEQSRHEQRDAQAQVEPLALRMSLVGAAPAPLVSGREELPGKMNYFTGKDPAKWRTNVPTYAKVHYREVYPGIDLIYYGNQRQMEYDFIVAPGADPKKIVLAFKGAERLEIDAQGDLMLHAPGGAIRQKKPVIYQEVDGVRQEIEGRYVRKGANRVGFKVAAYDASRPLVIDPVVLSYSTYLGGSGGDYGMGIAVDAAGAAYVTGYTGSTDFPTANAFQATHAGGGQIPYDVFVTKLNATGTALVYSTYLGGSGLDQGVGIAVDAAGAAYVTGGTESADFPVSCTAPCTVLDATLGAGGNDAFVTKLDPTGSALVYSTYLGGSYVDEGRSIAVDAEGAAYVTGLTESADFTAGCTAPCTVLDSTLAGIRDAFVTKLNAT
ncbi:MAG TPA: SBBP repeat-containing protein, partial [Terriglobales bacterium]|nr:SBBP repeat-containing protein [Terriglobales bacterium]